MVETDWKEILSYSQRELGKADKEKLCESLSWMEADDIELNFTDLKTLFRLSQDILKYKSEQVNNLLGQLETAQRKFGKSKGKNTFIESPSKSGDSVIETMSHQEEMIKANKEILEQLHADIAELEGRKSKLQEDKSEFDKDSESSRDPLSEINAIEQLENEVTMKNRHIRKLLGDVKALEEENTKLKEKISVLKEKLTEATQLIENFTEQLFTINNENLQLKEILGKTEKIKTQLSLEIEALRKELFEKESSRENIYEEIKSKVQHWKNIARSKKTEIETLSQENTRLKEDLIRASQSALSPTKSATANSAEKVKIKELQEKLTEASNEIIQSAKLIQHLKAENRQLKASIEDIPDVSVSDAKNESDDGKERTVMNKLKRKVKSLTVALQEAEEIIATREKQLTETACQLQQLKNDEGLNALLEDLKNKNKKLRCKDEEIKKLVQQVNNLNQVLSDLQLENETLRQKFNLPQNETIPTIGIMKKYKDLKQNNVYITKKLRKAENKLVNVELENRSLHSKVSKLFKSLSLMGCSQDKVNEVGKHETDDMPVDGGGESSTILRKPFQKEDSALENQSTLSNEEVEAIIEENEGLRKGLQEMLDFLKDNSTSSSGILALQCPSLDAILQTMEARHAAGWFAPHMTTVVELRAALGGKEALLTALHEARKETFEVMTKLSKESQKSHELEQRLLEIESKSESQKQSDTVLSRENFSFGEFGSWMSDKERDNIELTDKNQIETFINKSNYLYEKQLKIGLMYFHEKFKTLFEETTSIIIQASDDQNKWSIQEENYKAEIENLKARVNDDEDVSEVSPGLVSTLPDISFLQRKCSYLEESYKYIRTLNENIKNEYLECKREAMIAATEYENQIQRLILSVANLTDKLRSSISLELFWKQNEAFNDISTKYTVMLNNKIKNVTDSNDLIKKLESDKRDIIRSFRQQLLQNKDKEANSNVKEFLSHIEQTVLSKQIQRLCSDREDQNQKIASLEANIVELQNFESNLIDKALSSMTKEEVDLIKEQLAKLAEENKILKEQCQHVASQLDIALLQLQDSQQRRMNNDMEINLLRHQILDLQSTGDNKAIVARLSGEVLVAHLQATECNKKIETLNSVLSKEMQMRVEAEEMLWARQKIFDVYAFRYESKFRYMYEVMQIMRQQYQGSLPTISLETFLNNVEEFSQKSHDVDEKLDEIEELRSTLMTKHSVYNQILDFSKNQCPNVEDGCSYKLQNMVLQGTHSREIDHYKQKIKTLELLRERLVKRCNHVEKILVLVNNGFASSKDRKSEKKDFQDTGQNLEVEDIKSDDESSTNGTKTFTLPKPQILKQPKSGVDMTKIKKDDATEILLGSLIKVPQVQKPEVVNVFVQTSNKEDQRKYQLVQTDDDRESIELKTVLNDLRRELDIKNNELDEARKLAYQQTEEISKLNSEKYTSESTIESMRRSNHEKNKMNKNLQITVEDLRKQIDDFKQIQISENGKLRELANEENKNYIDALNKFESDKNAIIAEYKELLDKERNEYSKSVKDLQVKIFDLETQLDRKDSDGTNTYAETLKKNISKYTFKISELEDKCFKYKSELESQKSELKTYQSELDRWKDLANERLSKMEQLNSQLEQRHCHEVESYKAENAHWLSQLNETQREHSELRSRLTEQKAMFMKQLSDKDAQIEQLRSVIHGLKNQIMSMQTMISVADPSFDLSAIVEVEEVSDVSQQGSDRLELKFDLSGELYEAHDDRLRSSSTTVWQESVIERLRREKQMTSKQNAILRRQVKALAARERRARLDAQNLKNQVYRISTSGNKVGTVETAALHNKIASLQAQLSTARRDSHSTVALWDKWKRAQQSADRWQTRYAEKCQELQKAEANINMVKSAVTRLEKEKRVLLTRLTEVKEKEIMIMEKQDGERSEKSVQHSPVELLYSDPPVSAKALLDRVQAQQRRIAALEVAEKGNEHLVAEYEKALAEITALKGKVLKLETTLFESQIRIPIETKQEQQPELEYFKSYCEMLKEENVQLHLKVNSMAITPHTTSQHRINDLEQTVLALRGLVSKLQAEQKAGVTHKIPESRPSSGRSYNLSEKNRNQLESYRIEIANLKRSIHDKDLLLERSKEMLKIAAEREDELLQENIVLKRQLNELTSKRGFMSA